MTTDINYIIITPVRNEEKHIEKTIRSVISQTMKPVEWIIVDDGSTDRTSKIINRYTKDIPWIKAIHRKDKGFRKTGGKIIEVFFEGYAQISSENWEFIVKLDADLSFDKDYFESLIGRFIADKHLGIASGVYLELDKANVWRQVQMPSYHAAGACKVIRRKCYEEIGGFIVASGWDTVDEIRAIARGWETRHFKDLQMKHHKPEGSGIGTLRTSVMHGEIYYLTGGDKLFFVLKVFHRIASKPYLFSALALLWGYLRAASKKRNLLVNGIEAHCYRAMLRKRLRLSVTKMMIRDRIS